MRTTMMAASLIALLAAGCATPLEVENFELTDAKVVDLADGGKAMLMTSDTSEATQTVELAAGDYELIVYAMAASLEEDAFFVTVGDSGQQRRFPKEVGKVLPADPVPFTVAEAGPVKIEISCAEANVKIDRVEIKPVEPKPVE
jgi:hypothetical protein